ncbi:hypothetical protein Golob_022550, partial [Gossypium lobatum]|nr:hypothetical protein [Gossypium lobatum]
FNVYGIANEVRASYGGVLRDKERVTRVLFSGSVATNDTDLAEIGGDELGLIVVFNWCANKLMRPWSLQTTFADIERDIDKVGNVVFSMAEKNGNEMTSSLTIASINREEMFKAWW